ncbi:hypothetical protein E2R60_03570 [Paenibacillus dendritiformis]|uniref:hypothetical protein n=1 Tax=Paenibacillus dendritiformis TaxID=130049 RepID=UPI001059D56A|nr:hypothetical protein [Paenibacillus dendritiformis]TDL57592.1 hypothetical protein E2R60_03570 [Paenibacillus dendritiformis]
MAWMNLLDSFTQSCRARRVRVMENSAVKMDVGTVIHMLYQYVSLSWKTFFHLTAACLILMNVGRHRTNLINPHFSQADIGIALVGPCGTIVHDMFIRTNILGARQ